MKKAVFAIVMIMAVAATGFSADKNKGDSMKRPGLYAIFDTSMGEIICELYEKEAPNTVANFVGLAEGTKEFIDPRTGKKTKGKKT